MPPQTADVDLIGKIDGNLGLVADRVQLHVSISLGIVGLTQQGNADPPHVVLDPLNTWNVFGGDNERPLFLFGQIGGPQMHHAVLDDYVRGRNLGPFLRLQFGQQLFSYITVIGAGAVRGLVDRHGERLYEVSSADDSDKLAVTLPCRAASGAWRRCSSSPGVINRVDNRMIILFGFLLTALSMWQMTQFSLQMGMAPVIFSGLLQGFGLGCTFVPLNIIALSNLPRHILTQGTAIRSLMRNLGGSIGISVLVATLAENTQVVHSRLAEGLRPDNPLAQAPYLAAPFSLTTPGGIAALNAEVTRQAAMVAYIDDFKLMMLITLASVPLLLLLREERRRPPLVAVAATAAADD